RAEFYRGVFVRVRARAFIEEIMLYLLHTPCLYYELGPCSISPEGNHTTYNPYSWISNSSIIFLDQPTNAGYSYGDYVYDTFAAAHDKWPVIHLMGPVLDNSTCNQLRRDYIPCAKLTKRCYDSKNVTDCVAAEQCLDGMALTCFNVNRSKLDIRKSCYNDSCYPERQAVEKYSNREDVKTELGVNPSFVFRVSNTNLKGYFINSGIEAWIKALEWSGAKGFNNANVTRWITTTGNYAGDVKTFKGLTYLKIFEAGHLVAHDQPIATLDFFNKWIFNKNL
ncbi:10311_t:CDS:2, partial [Racocetra persica]